MIVILLSILMAALITLGYALRGRMVGTDPHCRHCGFNLKAHDAISRCSECGQEISPATIQIGQRQRRMRLATAAAIVMVLAAVPSAVILWNIASEYDWSPWKTTSWLIADIESAAATEPLSVAELDRRIRNESFAQQKVDMILDHALSHQVDRTARWDPAWSQLLGAAVTTKRLSDERAQRYLRQGFSAALSIKPKLRRGQWAVASMQISFDRMLPNTRLFGHFEATPLQMDSAIVAEHFIFGEAADRELGQGSGYTTAIRIDKKSVAALADGKHEMSVTLHMSYRSSEPLIAGPVTFKVPTTAPVELFAADAIVDQFAVDPAQRAAMRSAFLATRVMTAGGRGEFRVKTGQLPVPIAADVFIRQGTTEQKIGSTRIDGQSPRWSTAWANKPPQFVGTVDVILRPSQEAADNTPKLSSYWGEDIVIRDVAIDAPYVAPFVQDESLRAAVEESIRIPTITRTATNGSMLGIDLNAYSPPIKLAYRVSLQLNGRVVQLREPWNVQAKRNEGWGTSCPEIDSDGKATECDVIYRPDPQWESNSTDLQIPWGGEVVQHHVPIKGPATNPAK